MSKHLILSTGWSACAPAGRAPGFTRPTGTTDPSRVTCLRCLAALAKTAAR